MEVEHGSETEQYKRGSQRNTLGNRVPVTDLLTVGRGGGHGLYSIH